MEVDVSLNERPGGERARAARAGARGPGRDLRRQRLGVLFAVDRQLGVPQRRSFVTTTSTSTSNFDRCIRSSDHNKVFEKVSSQRGSTDNGTSFSRSVP